MLEERYLPGFEDNVIAFVLMNIVFILSYAYFVRKLNSAKSVILAILVFCVFGFWNSDYTFMRYHFIYDAKEEYSEVFYYYLAQLSFGSYYIYRLFIWGGALALFMLAVRKFNLNRNTSLFLLVFFFILTFSNARASLAMSAYLLGIYYLLPNSNSKIRLVKALFFLVLSFLFHRSFLICIVFSPILVFNFNRKFVILLLIFVPLFVQTVNYLLGDIISGQIILGDIFESFSNAVTDYAGREGTRELNWKMTLINSLRNASFYVSTAYIVYYSIKYDFEDIYIKKVINYILILIVFSSLFLVEGLNNYFYEIIGYRYLYMTAMPIILMLTYMYDNGIISRKVLYFNLFLPFLYEEVWFLGKLI